MGGIEGKKINVIDFISIKARLVRAKSFAIKLKQGQIGGDQPAVQPS